MSPEEFERIAREELARIPSRFALRIENLAILIEETPSHKTLREEGMQAGEILLGLYRGVPATERGADYGGVLPDTITLYMLPLLEEARALREEGRAAGGEEALRLALRETLWHELGHHFGLSEDAVGLREAARTNRFDYAQGAGEALPRPRLRGMIRGALRPAPGRQDRITILTSIMAKTLAIVFGIIFVLAGLLGFVGNSLVGSGALFEADAAHNLVHLVFGLILLAVALWSAAQSALWLKIIGAIYLVVALLGFMTASSGSLLGIVAINDADNWLHLVLGIALLAAGFLNKSEAADGMTPMSSMSPPAEG